MPLRRTLLLIALVASLGAWFWLKSLEWSYREEPYSQIEDGLYMGQSVSEPPPGTTAVLNLCEREDTFAVDTLLWEPINDSKAPSLEWLRRMVEFVERERESGATTYVHCLAGVSRSGLVVTAYLMKKHGWTRDEALAFVRKKRPQASPNPNFMVLLDEWEVQLRDQDR